MTTEFQVSLYEGKYTYERDDDGQQRALRYGEPWRDLVGDKFVAAMGYEIERLQEMLIDDSRLRDDLIKAEKEIERLSAELFKAKRTNSCWLRENAPGGWIDTLRKDLDEQRRLLGAGSEREARLMAQLAESQAREEKLRGVLMDGVAHLAAAVSAYEKFVGRADRRGQRDPFFSTRFSDFTKAEERTRETLALPHDDSALKERLAKERERIAKVFEQKAHDYAREYGHDDMGSLSFGQGIGGEIKMDYYSDLLANASLIRNLGDE